MTGIRHFAVAAASGLLLLGVVGCQHDRPETLSPNAMMQVEGNKSLNFDAPSDGKVTVYNSDTDHIVYASEIKKSQNINVDVENNRISLNGQTAVENNLHKGDQYRIFFEPTSVTERTSRVQTDTVESSHDR
jgi:hypothetical protein